MALTEVFAHTQPSPLADLECFEGRFCKEAWYVGYHLLPTTGFVVLDLCKLIICSARCRLDLN